MVFLQFILLIAAGLSLFGIWRRFLGDDPRFKLVVAISFLLRAIPGQILFWISFLDLPIAKSMHQGRGLWFFAIDAETYSNSAAAAAARGFGAILSIPRVTPSVTYVQVLALISIAFGYVVSASLLLNLFCFLGACAIVARWRAVTQDSETAALIVVAAIGLSPSSILWFMQPLKDSLLQFLIVAFVGACFFWQRSWQTGHRLQAILAASALVATVYLISGIRWYVGVILLGAVTLFVGLVAASLSHRKLVAATCGLVLVIAMARACAFVSKPYLPGPVLSLLQLHLTRVPEAAVNLQLDLERTRAGFARTGGNTSIHPGPRLGGAEAAGDEPVPKNPPALPPPQPSTVAPPALPPPTIAQPSEPAKSPSTRVATPTEPVPLPTKRHSPTPLERFSARLFAGTVALTMPRILASKLGLVEIGGRQALWWFVEVDTLAVDLLLLIVLLSIARRIRDGSIRNAVFWLVVTVTFLLSIALVYTVTNFGTLFRLRGMISTCIAMAPLAFLSMREKKLEP